jgi:hypothetical protein
VGFKEHMAHQKLGHTLYLTLLSELKNSLFKNACFSGKGKKNLFSGQTAFL